MEGLPRRRVVPGRPARRAADRALRGAGLLRRRVRARRAPAAGARRGRAGGPLRRARRDAPLAHQRADVARRSRPVCVRRRLAPAGRRRRSSRNLGHLLWSRVPPATTARCRRPRLLLSPASFRASASARSRPGRPSTTRSATTTAPYGRTTTPLVAKGPANYGPRRSPRACSTGCSRRCITSATAACRSCSAACRRHPGTSCAIRSRAARRPGPRRLFLLLQAVLGLHVDAPRRRLQIRNACLPRSMDCGSWRACASARRA